MARRRNRSSLPCRLYLMLVRRWARRGIAGIGIPAIVLNIGLITVFYGPVPRAHLPAQEHGNADQERAAHDQRRCERRQIGEHA